MKEFEKKEMIRFTIHKNYWILSHFFLKPQWQRVRRGTKFINLQLSRIRVLSKKKLKKRPASISTALLLEILILSNIHSIRKMSKGL